MCQDRILEAAISVDGVLKATYNLDTKELSLETNEQFNKRDLARILAAAGHDSDLRRADQHSYEALPGCCKYRDPNLKPCSPDEGQANPESASDSATEDFGFVSGIIQEKDDSGELRSLPGVNVYWKGTELGASTDEEGKFRIERDAKTDSLVVSYVGFDNDTINMSAREAVNLVLSQAVELGEVEVRHKRRSTSISFMNAIKIESLNEKELCKAACCNLSESFETNASVNASLTDAVTGTRQIEMLGLAGPYVQLTQENMPGVRGLAALYGMSFTPGPFIESIQINQGTGSVLNGFESMVGQINVELKKPAHKDRLFLNLFANMDGRMEANLILADQIAGDWSSSLQLHAREQPFTRDMNKDGFIDSPIGGEYILVNRHRFKLKAGWDGQAGIKAVLADSRSGQAEFDPNGPIDSDHPWGSLIENKRLEAWTKIGKLFEGERTSIGFQFAGSWHDLDSYFGVRSYAGTQKTLYGNMLYQQVLKNRAHQFTSGLSLLIDDYKEQLQLRNFDRSEFTPGAFVEYSYKRTDRFSAVAGLRVDRHNLHGLFVTPRLHLRYLLGEETVLRFVAGRGQRSASVIAENIGALASSRSIIIDEQDASKPYGLNAEISWNVGLNLSREMVLAGRAAMLSADIYRTQFQEQVVVDYDQSANALHFYNLEGQSFSNSAQIQFDIEALEDLEIRLAYRMNDVKTQYGEELRRKPLVAQHLAFANLAYETANKWQFDATISWNGQKRIPDLIAVPEQYQRQSSSPDFVTVNAQISKVWKDRFDWYLGAENLLNFRQDDPIIAVSQPFSEHFDASLVWGPVFGRMVYTGIRYRVFRK